MSTSATLPEFKPFQKLPRLYRDCVITDGDGHKGAAVSP